MFRKISLLRNIVYPGLLCCVVSVTHSQEVLTIEQAIGTALRHNFDIQLAQNDSMAAALNVSYTYAAFLPRLNAGAGATWNKNNQKQNFADGSKREQNGVRSSNVNSSVNLNWVLFDGLKMFVTRDKIEEFAKLGELGVKRQVTNTVADVINTYYNIVKQKQQLRAYDEQFSVTDAQVKLSQRKLEIGVGAKPDILQGQVDLNGLKANQLRQATLITQLKDELNQLMNVAPDAVYDVSDSIPVNMNILLGDVVSGAELQNANLMIARKNIDIARLTLEERKAERFPTVSFNSAYNFSKTDNKTTVNPFAPLFNQNAGFNYGFTASIPILNNFNTRRLIKQAQLDIDYNELFYQNQKSQVALSVIKAFKDYEFQKQALRLEEENIDLAKENAYIITERYRLGVSTFLELRIAQRSLEEAYNRLITARYNTKLAETELLRLKGDLVY
jgi:outer membrane protein